MRLNSLSCRGVPLHQAMCHCGNCRRAVGAQAVAWITFSNDCFEFVDCAPECYRSETDAIWSFCKHCGSTLTYENEKRPGEIDLTVGTLDDPEIFPPSRQVNEDERLSWV